MITRTLRQRNREVIEKMLPVSAKATGENDEREQTGICNENVRESEKLRKKIKKAE